jgi:hypothetical protein
MASSEDILLQRERNALERERLALEKLDKVQAENDKLKGRSRINWAIFAPVFVAVVGGTFSILGTAYSDYLQSQQALIAASETRDLSRETAEQELIKIAVQSEPGRALANMRFLAAADLLETYKPGVEQALARGETFSTETGRSRECLTAGCFYSPTATTAAGDSDRIWGNYQPSGRPNSASHGDQNAERFCRSMNFERALDFEVSCIGEDESAYLAWSAQQSAWEWIDSGSANDYCFPLLEWVRCN